MDNVWVLAWLIVIVWAARQAYIARKAGRAEDRLVDLRYQQAEDRRSQREQGTRARDVKRQRAERSRLRKAEIKVVEKVLFGERRGRLRLTRRELQMMETNQLVDLCKTKHLDYEVVRRYLRYTDAEIEEMKLGL